jgi:hypothetical protein
MHAVPRRRGPLPLCLALALVAAAAPALRADVEDTLRARLRGRFAILRSAVASECTDHYSDNDVSGDRASGSGPVRLPVGELVTIDNVHVGWTGFEVNVSLQVPYRVPVVDGPFSLFEIRRCRVQLDLDVPRDVRKDAGRSEAAVGEILAVFDDEYKARTSGLWNRREPEPLPPDNDRRWADYRIWKAAQVNDAVRRKLDSVLADAQAVLRSMRSDDDYLDSFARGVESRRYESTSSCDSLLSASFYVSGSGGKDRRGFEDGQRLAWATAVARGLQDCYVDAAPAP